MENLPKFSAYPWARVGRVSARDARLVSALARWIAARELSGEVVRVGEGVALDPHAPSCEVRLAGESIAVFGTAAAARALAQRTLGGPAELAAPRPLGVVEHALWALAVARVVRRLGVAAEVWPRVEPVAPPREAIAIELCGELGAVVAFVPRALELRAPPARVPAWADTWTIDAPVVLARCALPAGAAARLAVRDLVTVERCCDLEVFGGAVGLRASPKALVAEVVSGYVPRDMALPDDASVELTVGLGTTRLSLRQVMGLAVGEIVQLGRPLAGPFEVRAEGRLIGRGELVDVDGELAVRIVSLEA
ncbi:MAG: FliM/FliN family flagellar motor switch protein [Acidobacteriota bacterium]